MKHWIHLGTQKAGSSFLRGLLTQVPQIALTRQKELRFFGFKEDHSYEAYLACFPEKRAILFENTPVYFRDGYKCALPLAETMADKEPMLSLLLRDPVEAIISHHEMRLLQGFFNQDRNYAGDPRDLPAFVQRNPNYLGTWRYMDLLKGHWLPRFPRKSFAIGTFEEFTAKPIDWICDLAARAGLDQIGEVQVDRAWKNARPSSVLAYRLLTAANRNPLLRAIGRQVAAFPTLRKIAERAFFDDSQSSQRDDERIADMKTELAEHFRSDVARLCTFLGRETLPWPNFFDQARHPSQSAEPSEVHVAARSLPTTGRGARR